MLAICCAQKSAEKDMEIHNSILKKTIKLG